MEDLFSRSNLVSAVLFIAFGILLTIFCKRVQWDQKKYDDEHPLKEMGFDKNGAVREAPRDDNDANT